MRQSSLIGLRLVSLVAVLSLAFAVACGGTTTQTQEAPAQPAAAAPAKAASSVGSSSPSKPQRPEEAAPAAAARAATKTVTQSVAKPTGSGQQSIIQAPKQADPGAPKTGGTVYWAGFSNPPSTDWACHTTFRGGVGGHVYEGTFAFDDTRAAAIPLALSEWSLDSSGTEYSFTIRDGYRFHDNSAVTAADAVSSTLRWGASTHAIAKTVWDIAKPEHTIVDSKTWTMSTSQSFGLWPVYQAYNGLQLQPKSISDLPADECFDTTTQTIGSGPYKFVEWVPGDRVVMERFDGYTPRDEPANGGGGAKISYFDSIEMVVIPDASTQVAGLRTGQVHIVSTVSGDFKSALQEDPDVSVAVIGPGRPPYFVFNKTTKPFNNKKARQALLAAADMNDWMTASYGEGGDWALDGAIFMSDGPWATQAGLTGWNKYYKPNGVQIDKAKALMAEALAEEGMTFDDEMLLLAANNIFYMTGGGAYTKQAMESLGLKVNAPNVDWATVIQWKIKGCDKELVPGATAPGGGFSGYHTRTGPFDPLTNEGFSKTWTCGWQNPEIDVLIQDWLTAPTLEEQKALIDEMQVLVYEEVPYIQLGAALGLMAYRNEMAYQPSAGAFVLSSAWFK